MSKYTNASKKNKEGIETYKVVGLNILLFVSFVVTIMAPITGVVVHKLASTLFLLLCLIHTIIYRRKLGWKKILMLGCVVIAFMSGLFGMIFDHIPLVLQLHKTISIILVFFLAIHIFIYRWKFCK